MKKLWTSALSFLLVIIMIGGAAPLTLGAQNATYKVGDIVKYGSYPQSDVTASLGSVLNSQTGTWKSYGCFSGSGRNDGTQAASNIMRYKDVTYNGTKYRGVTFDKYRPDATYETASTSGKYMPQYENGYTCNKVYWFKFEPIAWRVLNPSSGLIMCEQIMDSQPFNPYDHRGSEYFFSSNYAESTIRNWLINDFYNTAFSHTLGQPHAHGPQRVHLSGLLWHHHLLFLPLAIHHRERFRLRQRHHAHRAERHEQRIATSHE